MKAKAKYGAGRIAAAENEGQQALGGKSAAENFSWRWRGVTAARQRNSESGSGAGKAERRKKAGWRKIYQRRNYGAKHLSASSRGSEA